MHAAHSVTYLMFQGAQDVFKWSVFVEMAKQTQLFWSGQAQAEILEMSDI